MDVNSRWKILSRHKDAQRGRPGHQGPLGTENLRRLDGPGDTEFQSKSIQLVCSLHYPNRDETTRVVHLFTACKEVRHVDESVRDSLHGVSDSRRRSRSRCRAQEVHYGILEPPRSREGNTGGRPLLTPPPRSRGLAHGEPAAASRLWRERPSGNPSQSTFTYMYRVGLANLVDVHKAVHVDGGRGGRKWG